MKRNIQSVVASLSVALALAGAFLISVTLPNRVSAAPKDDWKVLGAKLVDKTADRDEIDVGADEGTFKAIKLSVKGTDIEILSMRVVFASGDDQNIEVRKHIQDGGETRAIDLDGRKRVIKKVVLIYKSERGRERARVTLSGRD